MTRERKLYQPKNVHGHRVNYGYRSATSTRIDENYFWERDIEKLTVYDLVYKYLRRCADREGKRKQRHCACNKFQKQHARKKDLHGQAPFIRISFDEEIFDNNSEQLKSHASKNLLPRSTSRISRRRSSSKECIASYIKAIHDGQRRAKFYVRKALLYGLQSGLLIPTNEQKNVLRVSQKLGIFPSKGIEEEQLSTATSDTDYLYRYEAYPSRDYSFVESDILSNSMAADSPSSPLRPSSLSTTFSLPGTLLQPPFLAAVPPLMQSLSVPQPLSTSPTGSMSRHFITTNGITTLHKRPRSEKKPIPDDQKDEKYYERRKRNNQAAKKSRDARKIREDHIALRATMLEHENAILKAQIVTLREEAQSLRHMLIKQHAPAIQSIERSLSSMTPVTLSPPHTTPNLDC